MFRSYDFCCDDCVLTFDALVDKEATEEPCPDCGKPAYKIMSAPSIITGNDPESRKQKLLKRSQEHTRSEHKKNPEKLAAQLGGTPKAQSPWNIRSSKK